MWPISLVIFQPCFWLGLYFLPVVYLPPFYLTPRRLLLRLLLYEMNFVSYPEPSFQPPHNRQPRKHLQINSCSTEGIGPCSISFFLLLCRLLCMTITRGMELELFFKLHKGAEAHFSSLSVPTFFSSVIFQHIDKSGRCR